MELKKLSNIIENNFQKIVDDDYCETDWQKEGKVIDANLRKYENIKNILKNKVEEEKKINSNDESIGIIENFLEKLENEIDPLVKRINEKTKYFNIEDTNSNQNDDSNEPQGSLLVQDLQTNKELLEERRKQLEAIHQTSAKIKDMSDAMVQQLNEQGAILDEVETKVDTAKENPEKAKEEIKQADEMSRSNRKRLFCFIAINFIVVVLITSILLSLILG